MVIQMSSKGQIVIPAALRKKLKLTTRTQIRVEERDGQIILHPITREYIHSVRGMLKGSGMMKSLMEDKTWERENDERRYKQWKETSSLTRQR